MTARGMALSRSDGYLSDDDPLTWQRAPGRELVYLGLYFGAALVVADIVNVRLGVELLTLVVALAALAITRRPRLFLRDWWFSLVALVMWNLSGPIAAHSPFPAHLDFMLRSDRVIFLGHDPVVLLQRHLASAQRVNLLDVLTAVTYNLHLAEPYVAAYFLWRLNRTVYLRFAASVMILLVLGFITFIVFPAIPPWLAASRYHRVTGVINRFGPVLRAHPLPFHGTPIFYIFRLSGDAIAAFPSEHAAFPLLELLAFSSTCGRKVTALLILWVAWVLFSVVYLGEQWVTDALAGYVYAIILWRLVAKVSTSGATRASA